MRYCLLEVKKLLQEKLFMIFIVLCLCLNIGICFSMPDVRAEVNQSALNGVLVQGEKIYDALDADIIGSYYYNERYTNVSVLNRRMKAKYVKLQAAIELLNAENADLSPFAGEVTPLVHKALFTCQMKALLSECIIIISLLSLKLFSIERQTDMASLVYCSRRGRRAAGDKLLANGIIGAAYCLILYFISLTVFFTAWDFGGLWDANVASSFNYVVDSTDPILAKPFITWTSFSLKRYFACHIALSMGVILAWWLLTNLVTLITVNSRYGGAALAAMLCLPVFGLILFPGLRLSRLFYLDTLTLPAVVYCNQWWFTDMGNYSLFAYQEVWAVVLHILTMAVSLGAGLRCFKVREIMA